nr:MAG TPA: LMBE-RELATED PROTEIN, DEACETYLASE, ROSSMANN FOLD, ZINC-DEPENDENT.8A [Caudoviricetes sp.]
MGKRILVIAPHADDEVLGCGGYLLHQSKLGAEIRIIIATIGGTDTRQPFADRLREFRNVCDFLNADGKYMYPNKDAVLETELCFDITTKLDKEIDEFRPNEIFLNCLSRHQDHIRLYHCAMASLRLREGYKPDFVALYEYPFSTDSFELPNGGKAYHDISDNIEEKVKLFSFYSSQIRKSPSPLNDKGIKSLAAVRGVEAGLDYAELFYIQKTYI